MAATVYAVCNQKGGCAKTVTSVSFGIGLARSGKRVLLIDMDAQGAWDTSSRTSLKLRWLTYWAASSMTHPCRRVTGFSGMRKGWT